MAEERRKELYVKIRDFVWSDENDDSFDNLCVEIFEYRYRANEGYRSYCRSKGVTSSDVLSWIDIPAFPSDGFKKDIIVSFPLEKVIMENLTSGTTFPELRGSVLRDE